MSLDSAESLPRLVYLGDVPVESSYHGSALLFRLLENYPSEKLLIVESNICRSRLERRLPNVRYRALSIGYERVLRTRLAQIYSSLLHLRARTLATRVERVVSEFRPEAVLTVTHGYSWIAAARFAQKKHVPFHIICHDDWPKFANVLTVFKSSLDKMFRGVYTQATSRLCVSPFMVDAYRDRYGVDGITLYPSRAADCPEFQAPPTRLTDVSSRPTGIYGGSINSEGFAAALQALARSLACIGGRLLLFGPVSATDLQNRNLNLPNVEIRGLLGFKELIDVCRAEGDFLFVPMSFADEDRINMELSFPSKLTDYTAMGLPLLIYGPEYCSAVKWAKENVGVAEVVLSHNDGSLLEAVTNLMNDGALRARLAMHALELGRELFAHSLGFRKFSRVLTDGQKAFSCA